MSEILTSPDNTTSDVFLYRSSDPHTAIPDWLPFCRAISTEARNMAHAILVMSRGPLPPTREEIAEALGVDTRTIRRWLVELRDAGILTEQAVGRRLLCIFRNPAWVLGGSGDPLIARSADPCVSGSGDQLIARSADHPIIHAPHDRDQFLAQQEAPNSRFFKNPITDPPVTPSGGGGGDHDSVKDSPPTTTPTAKKAQPCETRLGRFMAANGFGAAREFDRPELDSNHWIHWIRLQLESGTSKERIVHMLRLGAPLEWQAPAPVAPAATDQDDEPPAEAWRSALTAPTIEEIEARRASWPRRKQ